MGSKISLQSLEDVVFSIAEELYIPQHKLQFNTYHDRMGGVVVEVSFRAGSVVSDHAKHDKYSFAVSADDSMTGLKKQEINDKLNEMEKNYLQHRDRLTIYNDQPFFWKYTAKVGEDISNQVTVECPSCEWSMKSDEYRQDLSGGGFLDRVLMSLLIESRGKCRCTT